MLLFYIVCLLLFDIALCFCLCPSWLNYPRAIIDINNVLLIIAFQLDIITMLHCTLVWTFTLCFYSYPSCSGGGLCRDTEIRWVTLVGEVDVKLWVPAVVALAQVMMLNKA